MSKSPTSSNVGEPSKTKTWSLPSLSSRSGDVEQTIATTATPDRDFVEETDFSADMFDDAYIPRKESVIRSSTNTKFRVIGKLASSFSEKKEINALKNEEAQIDQDLQGLHDFLNRMLIAQDTLLDVKRSAESIVQRSLHILKTESEFNMHMFRNKIEPELKRLGEALRTEITSYETIKDNHEITLSKLANAIQVLRMSAAVRQKIQDSKEKMSQEFSQSQRQMGSNSPSKAATELSEKLELHLDILNSLRERENRERIRLASQNAQLANEVDRLKNELKDSLEVQHSLKNKIRDLEESYTTFKDTRLRKRDGGQHQDGESAGITPTTPQSRFPNVAPSPTPTDPSNTVRPLSRMTTASQSSTKSYKEVKSRYLNITKSEPNMRKESKNSGQAKSPGENQPYRSSKISARDCQRNSGPPDSQREWFTNIKQKLPPCIWVRETSPLPRPQSFPLIQNPGNLFLQFTNRRSEVDAEVSDLARKLVSIQDIYTSQKYISWIHTADAVLHSFFRLIQPTDRETLALFNQIIWVYHDITMFYIEHGNYESASITIRKLDNLISVWGSSLPDELKYMVSNIMALVNFLKEKYTHALIQLQKSFKIIHDRSSLNVLETHIRFACVYLNSKNQAECLKHLNFSQQLCEDTEKQIAKDSTSDSVVPLFETVCTYYYNGAISNIHFGEHSDALRFFTRLQDILKRSKCESGYIKHLQSQTELLGEIMKEIQTHSSSSENLSSVYPQPFHAADKNDDIEHTRLSHSYQHREDVSCERISSNSLTS